MVDLKMAIFKTEEEALRAASEQSPAEQRIGAPAIQPVGRVAERPEVRRGYTHLNANQKLELLLERQELLAAKVDRIGMNTVNLAKNQNELGLVMNSIIGLLEVPEPEPTIIVSPRGV